VGPKVIAELRINFNFLISFLGQREVTAHLPTHAHKFGHAPRQDSSKFVLHDDPVQVVRHLKPRRKEEHGQGDVHAKEHLGIEASP